MASFYFFFIILVSNALKIGVVTSAFKLSIHVYPLDRYGHETSIWYSDGFVEVVCGYYGPVVGSINLRLYDARDGRPVHQLHHDHFGNTLKVTVPLRRAGRYFCNEVTLLLRSTSFETNRTMCSDGGECDCSGGGRISVWENSTSSVPGRSAYLDSGTCSKWAKTSAKLVRKRICVLMNGEERMETMPSMCEAMINRNVRPRFFIVGDDQCGSVNVSGYPISPFDWNHTLILMGDYLLWKLVPEKQIRLPVVLRSMNPGARWSTPAADCRLYFPLINGTEPQFIKVNNTYNATANSSILSIDTAVLNKFLDALPTVSRVAKLRCISIADTPKMETMVHFVLLGNISVTAGPLSCEYDLHIPRYCNVKMDRFKERDVKVSVLWHRDRDNALISANGSLRAPSFDKYTCTVEISYSVCSSYRKVLKHQITKQVDLLRCSPEIRLAESTSYTFWISIGMVLMVIVIIAAVVFACFLYERKRDLLTGDKVKQPQVAVVTLSD